MVRSRRWASKEDVTSVLTDSGVSLSSPPTAAPSDRYDVEHGRDLLAVSKKKVSRRRVGGAKAAKRARKYKVVAAVAESITKKPKIGVASYTAVANSNSAASAVSAKVLVNLEDADTHSAHSTAYLAESAGTESQSSTTAFGASTETSTNLIYTTVSVSEKSLSVADSAFSETDATQSVDLSGTGIHSVVDAVSVVVPSASSPLPAAAKRSRKVHVCHVCSKDFGGNTDLKRHMLIHSNERPYKCEQCGKCYRQAVNLKNHITTAHQGQRQFSCPQCPKMFALKERLRLHMRLHSGEKPYACTLCDKRFARGGQLQQHIVSHHKGSAKQYACEKCSASFSTPSNLRAHMDRHENGPDHYCEICKEHFPNEVVLRAHINKVHYKLRQFDCEICKKTIENDDLAKHMKTHSNVKTHICEVCNSYFMQKSQYNVHMRMHTGERPYQCRICWQTFAHSSVLKLHIRKHTGEKPFQCLICKDVVAFSQLAHLKTHMKKIHKQTNPYMCEGCQQFFKVKVELQAHMQQCDNCAVDVEEQNIKNNDLQTLSHLRFLMALLLKKISSQQKLQQLGYEKRLIDNVVVASLKLANRRACDDQKLPAIERMRLNVAEFLNWIVPAKVMETFRQEQLSVEDILDKIVTMYMKHK